MEINVRLIKVLVRSSDYGYYKSYLESRATAAKYAAVLPQLEMTPVEPPPEAREDEKEEYKSWPPFFVGECANNVWVTEEEYMMLLETVGNVVMESIVHKKVDLGRAFSTVADKQDMTVVQETKEYNQKCEVRMAGQALATYNDIMLKENCCSDELQDEINKGWRIIAACVQPDQRRPDYILGRFNPDTLADSGARR